MAPSRLDRRHIEKRDFPRARRGYDPEIVDAHLAGIAADVEALASGAPPQQAPTSIPEAVGESVQEILAAADRSAAETQRIAEERLAELSRAAERDAERIRDEALDQARQFLRTIADRSSAVRSRLRELEQAMQSSTESQSIGADALDAAVSEIEQRLDVLHAETGASASEPMSPSAASSSTPSGQDAHGRADREAAVEQPATDDVDLAARLVALNMALDERPREEVEQYLAEHFDVPDHERLVDEAYASAGDEPP